MLNRRRIWLPEAAVKGRRTTALFAILIFLVLSLAGLAIVRGLGLLYTLESRNEAERSMNALFTSLRNYDDFGAAIEQGEILRQSVLGLGLYDGAGQGLYTWGQAPMRYLAEGFPVGETGRDVRLYSENKANRSVVLVMKPEGAGHLPPPHDGTAGAGSADTISQAGTPRSLMLELMRHADVIYLELRQPELWNKRSLLWTVYPVVELIMAALIFFVRRLIVRNREYQEKLEAQKNLVVLGTAASTLAHEIKNPLLAIRLQTSILRKTSPEDSKGEIDIIDAEVERLSRMTTRVNDYLRDPRGFPVETDCAELTAEAGTRLLGRELEVGGDRVLKAMIDPERLRSILENLLRNALESGGDPGKISAELSSSEEKIRVDILDRGSGISPDLEDHTFTPFFTTKSKGTGIGLPICQRFAEAAGGSVRLFARDGGGARARLELPRVKEGRGQHERPEKGGQDQDAGENR
jgi:two-component system, NtrC family, sensor histidine kinase HydH